MIAIITAILTLAEQLGPTIVTLAVDLGPVYSAISTILSGKQVTDAQLAALQTLSDQLNDAIQASPETP